MELKDYLSQGFFLNKELSVLKERIKVLEETSVNISSMLLSEKVSGSKNVDRVGNAVVNILDAEDMYIERIIKLLCIKYDIQQLICRLERVEYKMCLELRYIDFYTWEKIAEIMNYSVRNVHNVHKKALNSLEKIIEGDRKINL